MSTPSPSESREDQDREIAELVLENLQLKTEQMRLRDENFQLRDTAEAQRVEIHTLNATKERLRNRLRMAGLQTGDSGV